MATTTQVQPTNRKFIVHAVLSTIVIAVGLALLVYMITVEDEPGALPLAMVVGGAAWLITARVRLRQRS